MTCDLFLANDVQADESMNSQNGKCSARGTPLSQRPSIAFLVAAAMALTACTSEKDRLDAEARRLCAIDGGIKVFETVTLSPEMFHPNGVPKISEKDDKGFGYFLTASQKNLKANFDKPTLFRHEYQVIRSGDQKVIAISVVYRRGGGSWWDGMMEGDGFTCPEDKVNTSFMEQVFFKGKSQ